MKSLYVLCLVVPSCLGFLAHIQKIRDHVSAKLKKPECHVEREDVTTPHCESYNEQVCVEEFQNHCHTESSQECSTEYSEVCETEHEQACHTEYSEECRDEPECWVEEKEECQDVQIKVQHQPKQKWSKWKRSVDGEVPDAEDVGDVDDDEEDGDVDDEEYGYVVDDEEYGYVDGDEEDGEVPAGEESVIGEAVATNGPVRKERSLKLARKIGRKIVSLAVKKDALKDKIKLKKASLKDKFKLKKAVKKAPAAPKVFHQTERVCRSV